MWSPVSVDVTHCIATTSFIFFLFVRYHLLSNCGQSMGQSGWSIVRCSVTRDTLCLSPFIGLNMNTFVIFLFKNYRPRPISRHIHLFEESHYMVLWQCTTGCGIILYFYIEPQDLLNHNTQNIFARNKKKRLLPSRTHCINVKVAKVHSFYHNLVYNAMQQQSRDGLALWEK